MALTLRSILACAAVAVFTGPLTAQTELDGELKSTATHVGCRHTNLRQFADIFEPRARAATILGARRICVLGNWHGWAGERGEGSV